MQPKSIIALDISEGLPSGAVTLTDIRYGAESRWNLGSPVCRWFQLRLSNGLCEFIYRNSRIRHCKRCNGLMAVNNEGGDE